MAKEKEDVVWELPVHRSLVKPMYWMGVPRGILIIELMLAVLGGILFKTFLVVVLVAIMHFIMRYFGQKDSMFLDVFMRYIKHSGYYR